MIIVPNSADKVLWASFAEKVDEIREDILRLPESKVESPAPLIPVPLPPSLSTQVEELVELWFKVKIPQHLYRTSKLTSLDTRGQRLPGKGIPDESRKHHDEMS